MGSNYLSGLTISLLLLLSGCATLPKEVDVPVAIHSPQIIIPSKPVLPISKLTAKSTAPQVMQAYGASIKILMSHCDELRMIIEAENNS